MQGSFCSISDDDGRRRYTDVEEINSNRAKRSVLEKLKKNYYKEIVVSDGKSL